SSDSDGVLQFWDLPTGKELRRLDRPDRQDQIGRLQALAPDGKTAALKGMGRDIVLMDLDYGKELRKLADNGDYVYRAAFTGGGRTRVVWAFGQRVRVWTGAAGQLVRKTAFVDGGGPVPAGGGLVYTADVSPDGWQLALGSQNRFIALYNLATGKLDRK